ncbi:hypothetical protein IXO704_001515 [Xanthomonas oryzae pv. oryzae]|nr:hypothetical protein IXO704_001515 [Xanthomonas oryzae pv. oryzae]
MRSSMACNSPVSSACHVVHALVQAAVAGCRLGDALVRRSRATMHERRASDLIRYRATASAHATCALSASVVGAARGQRCQSGCPSRWTDKHSSAGVLHATQLPSPAMWSTPSPRRWCVPLV